VIDYCLMPNDRIFSHIMVRKSYILMRWRCLFYTRATWRIEFLPWYLTETWIHYPNLEPTSGKVANINSITQLWLNARWSEWEIIV